MTLSYLHTGITLLVVVISSLNTTFCIAAEDTLLVASHPDLAPLRNVREFYVVSEKSPVTGEAVGSERRFGSRLEAMEYRESLRAGAWVVWRYAGIQEPLRSARFGSRSDAEQFVRTGGPARRLLGLVLLTNETRILPAKVTLAVEHVR